MNIHKVIVAATVVALPSVASADGAAAFDKSMQPILESYLKIQDALASDKTTGVKDAARAIETASKKLDAKSVTGEHAKHYEHLPMKLAQAAKKLAAAGDIDSAREALKELSKPMAMWGTMSKPKGVVVVFCSMAKGSWLQRKGGVRNPYYGASMLACGEIVGGDDAGMEHKGMKHDMHGGH
jgi:Cu(I)/Ag(I) efflux system membrane fusion protein